MMNWLPLFFLFFSQLAAVGERNVRDLYYMLENQQTQIDQIRERLENQENIIDLVRDSSDRLQSDFRATIKNQEAVLESSQEGSKLDIEAMQSCMRETNELFQKRLENFETTLKQQAKMITSLQSALQSTLEALSDQKEESYEVVEGDSLEKIARKYNTTIYKLKEINHLQSDRILIGQKLKISSSQDEK